MEELIKRLERVIATGVPDKDGQHPISAEVVLEVVKGLSELSTNLASLGTDCISREQAIEAIEDFPHGNTWNVESMEEMVYKIRQLPPIQPKRIRGQWSIKGQAIDTVRGYWAKCSACGHSVFGGGNYCSYCGSYNKGEVME